MLGWISSAATLFENWAAGSYTCGKANQPSSDSSTHSTRNNEKPAMPERRAHLPSRLPPPTPVSIGGWTLIAGWPDGEPRIGKYQLAARLESRAHVVQAVIDRLSAEEGFGEVMRRLHRVRLSKGGHRDVSEPCLTEEQAVDVVLDIRTPVARKIRKDVIRAFCMYRRSTTMPPASTGQSGVVPAANATSALVPSALTNAQLAHWLEPIQSDLRRLGNDLGYFGPAADNAYTEIQTLRKKLEELQMGDLAAIKRKLAGLEAFGDVDPQAVQVLVVRIAVAAKEGLETFLDAMTDDNDDRAGDTPD